MNDTALEQKVAAFNRLNEQMSDIDQFLPDAPGEHAAAYEHAMLTCLSKNTEMLVGSTELQSYFQNLGGTILATATEMQTERASLSLLRSLVDQGLLDKTSMPVEHAEITPEFGYQTRHFEAFDVLYGAVKKKTETIPKVNAVDEIQKEGDSSILEDEVNILDILEHLETHGMSPVELKFIERALEGLPVKVDNIRRHEWLFIRLSKQEFNNFSRCLSTVQNKAVELLEPVGVAATWRVVKKGRSQPGYQLLIGAEAEEALRVDPRAGLKSLYGDSIDILQIRREDKAPRPPRSNTSSTAAETVPDKVAESPAPSLEAQPAHREKNVQLKENILFAHGLKQFVLSVIDAENCRLNHVMRRTAEELGITRLEARDAIKNLVNTQDVFWGPSSEGSRTLAAVQVAIQPKRLSAQRNGEEASSDSQESDNNFLNDQETAVAVLIIDFFAASRYIQQGETVKALIRDFKPDDMAERDFRRLVRKLEARRYLVCDNSGNYGRARKGALVKLHSQDFKESWKTDRAANIERFKMPIN